MNPYEWRLIARLSLHNLLNHRVKSLIIGVIILMGSFLVVVGTAMLDSIESSMSRSIISSLAGHLQVYSNKGKDELAIFGGMMMAAEDIGKMPDFKQVKQTLSADPNVKAIIPMGIDFATIFSGNEIDDVLEDMRKAAKINDQAALTDLRRKLMQLVSMMRQEFTQQLKITSNIKKYTDGLKELDVVSAPEFWKDFETNPLPVLDHFDSKIAGLAADGVLYYFRYVGTDLAAFQENFDRLKIVRGEMVPKGKRGFLFNNKILEDYVKNKVARDLDWIHRKIIEDQKPHNDSEVRTRIRQNMRQFRKVTFQLTPANAEKLEAELDNILKETPRAPVTDPKDDFSKNFAPLDPNSRESRLNRKLQDFLWVDSGNIARRYEFFYKVVAPMIKLYPFNAGDTITLRGLTKSGYMKAVNVKVYGVFEFEGLGKSDLAGGHSLMDIMTFRDLYGFLTDDKKKELAEIKSETGIKEVNQDNAEAELFGSAATPIEKAAESDGTFDEFAGLQLTGQKEFQDALMARSFDQEAVDNGVALNAAIILKDPGKLRETQMRLEETAKAAKLDLKVVDWQKASGIVGQFVVLVRVVLFIAIFIIFAVALVIINNSMVMATMERVMEIGTMRAIGAQSRLVLTLFLSETLLLATISGGLGAFLGAGFISWLGRQGIPAVTDILVFLFSGPKLFPEWGVQNLVIAFAMILMISLISTFYPALIATRIRPAVAMSPKE
ncbi:MAG: hypothetical protein GMKNLPBB_02451 [Myxococcota bacterium]|nr:hypothetical protein [Myxococcota bacterium]